MSKIQTIVEGRKEGFLTRVLIATALFAEKFYAGKSNNWGLVTSDAAKAAEAQFNDPDSGVFGSATFAATIKAMTGEAIQLRAPSSVQYSVGVVVVPVAPTYGKRTDDGYELGKAYLCTNESSGGKFRNADNIGAKMTNGSRNQIGLMSRISDEVRPATEEEITALVNELFTDKALSLLHDLEYELARYDAFIGK
jgi:hypothetical protein